MKKSIELSWLQRTACPMALGALMLIAQQGRANQIGFSSLFGAQLNFHGTAGADTFDFTPGGGLDQFVITSGGDSVGDFGYMTGTYTIGTVAPVGPLLETARVTGSGTLNIHDGLGKDLTAVLTWDTIATVGIAGIINLNGVFNLSSILYNGTEADLLALAAVGTAPELVFFPFIPAKTLTQLKETGQNNSTSFSGSIAFPVPDGGLTAALLGFALVGMEGLRRKLRK